MAKAKSSSLGMIQHIAGVRYRVVGDGNLKTRLLSYSEVKVVELADTVLVEATDRMPLRLANFRSQATQIEFKTTLKDEIFTIGQIVVYIKPSATSYPQ